ncbi:MAG: Mut7-C RNAse domain-containing protein [Halanaeroarchaeum sp.]
MATPGDTKLLLDVMCGGLRSVLRMVGYDTVYALDRGLEADVAIREIALAEHRVLVTRDRPLAERTPGAVCVESTDTDEQLAALSEAGFALDLDEPTRCSACNGLLVAVGPDEPTPAYAPDPAQEACWRCRACGQVYWRGSHWDDVDERLAHL